MQYKFFRQDGISRSFAFQKSQQTSDVLSYVDGTFAVFNDKDKCNEFFSHLNSLYSSLRFTFEKKCNRTLPFLDVLVETNDHEFVTSIYRKPLSPANTFAGTLFAP